MTTREKLIYEMESIVNKYFNQNEISSDLRAFKNLGVKLYQLDEKSSETKDLVGIFEFSKVSSNSELNGLSYLDIMDNKKRI